MSDFLFEVLAAIPTAASSPIALVAYSATIIVWGIFAFRSRTLESVRASIQKLHDNDRIKRARTIIGGVSVDQSSPDRNISFRGRKYLFFNILVLCFAAIVTTSLAVKEALDKESLTDVLVDEVLGTPSLQYRNAFDLVENTPTAVVVMAQALLPRPSQSELDALALDLKARGYRSDQIDRILAAERSGGEVEEMNQMARKAVTLLNETFAKLADCFRERQCAVSAEKMPKLCGQVIPITSNIRTANEEALSIPGVIFIGHGSTTPIGDVTSDRIYRELVAENLEFIRQQCA